VRIRIYALMRISILWVINAHKTNVNQGYLPFEVEIQETANPFVKKRIVDINPLKMQFVEL